jgi:hypothetical protein
MAFLCFFQSFSNVFGWSTACNYRTVCTVGVNKSLERWFRYKKIFNFINTVEGPVELSNGFLSLVAKSKNFKKEFHTKKFQGVCML